MGHSHFLRLTVKQSTIEAIWGDNKSYAEIINPIPKVRFQEYQESWRSLLGRVQSMNAKVFSRSIDELNDLLKKKSRLLSEILCWSPPLEISKLTVISDLGIPELPYEILPYKSGYLVDHVMISRDVRRYAKPVFYKKAEQILYVTHTESKETLKESLVREEKSLSKALKQISLPLTVLKDRTMRPPRFLEELLVSKFFIYCGHLDPANIPFSSDAPISSSEIAKMDLSQLKIAFLNGCSGFQTLNETLSLAQGFLTAGAEFIIGFSEPVNTKDAERASVLFWTKFVESHNVEEAYRASLREWKSNQSWNRFIFAKMGQFQEAKKEKFSLDAKTAIFASVFILLSLSILTFGFLFISTFKPMEKNFFVQDVRLQSEKNFEPKILPTIKIKNRKDARKQNSDQPPAVNTQTMQETSKHSLITKVDPPASSSKVDTNSVNPEMELSEMIERTSNSTLKRNLYAFISEPLDVEEKKYRILKTKEILSNFRGEREIRIEMMKNFGSSFEAH